MSSLHVHPRDDVVEHELTDECVCIPEQRFINNAWLVVHHSLDGRESSE